MGEILHAFPSFVFLFLFLLVMMSTVAMSLFIISGLQRKPLGRLH